MSKIYAKCGLLDDVWGFIDSTMRKTFRPTYFKNQSYSGYKRCHGFKWQSAMTPNGLLAFLWGPVNGNKYDSRMLCESNLLTKMWVLMPKNGYIFGLYGNPTYP